MKFSCGLFDQIATSDDGCGIGHRIQYQTVVDREERGVGRNADRQGEDGDAGESRRVQQGPDAGADVRHDKRGMRIRSRAKKSGAVSGAQITGPGRIVGRASRAIDTAESRKRELVWLIGLGAGFDHQELIVPEVLDSGAGDSPVERRESAAHLRGQAEQVHVCHQ